MLPAHAHAASGDGPLGRRADRRTDSLRLLLLNQYFAPDTAATAQLLGDLADAAAREGHEVEVVSSDRSYADPDRRYPRREEKPGIRIRRVPATAFGRLSRVGRMLDYGTYLCGATLRACLAERPDVVVGLSTPPILGFLAILLARLRGSRSCYWVMDVYPEMAFALGVLRPDGVVGRLLSSVARWTIVSADVVIALGETMAQRLSEHGARRIVVVHNWADGDALRPIPHEQNSLRTARGWQAKFVVLYSGNMGLAHEFETVLSAVDRLRADSDVLFAFVGRGPRRSELESAVRRRSLPNVTFLDPVPREQLGPSLAAADLHLITLRPGLDGLLVPSKIYGCLASGRPCLYVGPAGGELHEIVSSGCGTSVRNGDAEALIEAVRRYRNDNSARRQDGECARSVFEARFTRERQVRALLDVLRNAAG